MSVFHCFGNLPTEIRLIVWAEAVCLDNKDRVLLLECGNEIFATRRLLRASGVFGATAESREVALKLYPVRFAFPEYYVMTSPHPTLPSCLGGPIDSKSQRVIHVSFERDIFFLEVRWWLWVQACDRTPEPALWRTLHRKTAALTRQQRSMIQRVMETSTWTRHPQPGGPSEGPRLLTADDIGPRDHMFNWPGYKGMYPNVRECHHIITDNTYNRPTWPCLIDLVFRDAEWNFLDNYRVGRTPCGEHDPIVVTCDLEKAQPND